MSIQPISHVLYMGKPKFNSKEKNGDLLNLKKNSKRPPRKCAEPDCTRIAKNGDYCTPHCKNICFVCSYLGIKKLNGDPIIGPQRSFGVDLCNGCSREVGTNLRDYLTTTPYKGLPVSRRRDAYLAYLEKAKRDVRLKTNFDTAVHEDEMEYLRTRVEQIIANKEKRDGKNASGQKESKEKASKSAAGEDARSNQIGMHLSGPSTDFEDTFMSNPEEDPDGMGTSRQKESEGNASMNELSSRSTGMDTSGGKGAGEGNESTRYEGQSTLSIQNGNQQSGPSTATADTLILDPKQKGAETASSNGRNTCAICQFIDKKKLPSGFMSDVLSGLCEDCRVGMADTEVRQFLTNQRNKYGFSKWERIDLDKRRELVQWWSDNLPDGDRKKLLQEAIAYSESILCEDENSVDKCLMCTFKNVSSPRDGCKRKLGVHLCNSCVNFLRFGMLEQFLQHTRHTTARRQFFINLVNSMDTRDTFYTFYERVRNNIQNVHVFTGYNVGHTGIYPVLMKNRRTIAHPTSCWSPTYNIPNLGLYWTSDAPAEIEQILAYYPLKTTTEKEGEYLYTLGSGNTRILYDWNKDEIRTLKEYCEEEGIECVKHPGDHHYTFKKIDTPYTIADDAIVEELSNILPVAPLINEPPVYDKNIDDIFQRREFKDRNHNIVRLTKDTEELKGKKYFGIQANSEFVDIPLDDHNGIRHILLARATRRIPKGCEIFAYYGSEYMREYTTLHDGMIAGPESFLPFLPNASSDHP